MAADPEASGHLFRRAKDVDETRVGERVVLYHTVHGGAFVLNPTASILWDSLSSPRELKALAEVLRSRFPSLPSDRAVADVRNCLGELQSNKLVVAE